MLLITAVLVFCSVYLPVQLFANSLDSLAKQRPIANTRIDLFPITSSTWLISQPRNSSRLTAVKGELTPTQVHLENLKSNIEDLKTRDWINKFFLLALCWLLLIKTEFIGTLKEEWQKNRWSRRLLKIPSAEGNPLSLIDKKEVIIPVEDSLKLEENKELPSIPPNIVIATVRTNLELLPDDQLWLETLQQAIHKNLANIYFDIAQLADELMISRRHLNRKVRQCTGLSTHKYIQETRLLKAKEILENQQPSAVKVVAYEVGFKDVKYFGQLFKKRFGRLPSSYL